MADSKDQVSFEEVEQYFDHLLRLADRGVGKDHTGKGDGVLSVAEVAEAFSQNIEGQRPALEFIIQSISNRAGTSGQVKIEDIRKDIATVLKELDNDSSGSVNAREVWGFSNDQTAAKAAPSK